MHLSASEYTTLRSSAFLLLVLGLSLMHHLATAQLVWDDEDDDFGKYTVHTRTHYDKLHSLCVCCMRCSNKQER